MFTLPWQVLRMKNAAINFAEVFCSLLDNHRDQLAAHLTDDAVLYWFGHRISSKGSVVWFMKSHVPETVHNLKLVKPSRTIQHWQETLHESVDDENNVVTSEGQKLHEDPLLSEGLVKPFGSSGCMVHTACSKEIDVMSKFNLNSMPLERSRIEKYKSFEPFQPQFGTQ